MKATRPQSAVTPKAAGQVGLPHNTPAQKKTVTNTMQPKFSRSSLAST